MDTSKGYPLLVAQYELKGHPTRTEHWNLVIMLSENEFEIHELRGNFDTFTYVSEKTKDWIRYRTLCGGCLVGYVPEDKLEEIPKVLKEIEVVRHNQSFDCQVWVVRVLYTLKKRQGDGLGVVFEDISEKFVRNELADELERDETGHSLVHERILAGEV